MKKLLLLLLLIGSTTYVSAQNFGRGFSLGADRDTLLYIIASPFDNWYFSVGGGIQTFHGNEIEARARFNKLNFNGRIEIGKWIIPDVAVSLRFSMFNVDGQSRYGLQPFIDFTNVTPDSTGYLDYQPFHGHAASILGFVTFDWTNFLNGYDAGKRTRLHIFMPIGLGMSVFYGKQINPNPRTNHEVGEFRKNRELAFSLGFMAEYIWTRHISLNAHLELFGSESTWDWSPYDNAYSIFDFIPTLSVSAKINLLRQVKKYNQYTQISTYEQVNHEFLAFGARNTVIRLTDRIEKLNEQIDSVQNLSGQLMTGALDELNAIIQERDSLQDQLDNYNENYNGQPISRPLNVIEELLNMNEILGLPACVVYYELDRYDLDYNARKTLQKFAKEMNKMEDTLEFYIIGAADSVTGTASHNQWLSEKRCQAAYNMLTQHFGANKNQLRMEPVGGIMEYYPKENNRMALIILRTPVTEEIVERWRRKQ